MFLWHFPWGRPRWTLSSIPLCGVRTFLRQPAGRPRLLCLLRPAIQCIILTQPSSMNTAGKRVLQETPATNGQQTNLANRCANPLTQRRKYDMLQALSSSDVDEQAGEHLREWLRGRASPCQGEGRGFKSRLPLQSWVEHSWVVVGLWRRRQVVRQGSAKPPPAVRIRSSPPVVSHIFLAYPRKCEDFLLALLVFSPAGRV